MRLRVEARRPAGAVAVDGARQFRVSQMEVGDDVYVIASSGAKDYSYESKQWGHGAFTLALLRSLGQKELARDGVIHFNALVRCPRSTSPGDDPVG